MSRKIEISKNKFHLDDEIEEVLEGEVKKIGDGGMVLVKKKDIGKRVYILVRKN
jgi:putative transposon-encoded protein